MKVAREVLRNRNRMRVVVGKTGIAVERCSSAAFDGRVRTDSAGKFTISKTEPEDTRKLVWGPCGE